ncbi:uncharacterized protein BCR38DRAFT_18835 [Pseudomassariella vexata]|uniref:Uncharacterized protein n=1 Tax=Pseudomassariella vexata TaxID=1141098 RepID=A0A1Y2EJJ1_9PEZI|nr:uncharacterized protein BCR38DRAFT_18835 [Pseudomassariella vexata]ORY71728.1 hypothetical protein BCR38DRAFT_18835 [Pseudomassariella vexata]
MGMEYLNPTCQSTTLDFLNLMVPSKSNQSLFPTSNRDIRMLSTLKACLPHSFFEQTNLTKMKRRSSGQSTPESKRRRIEASGMEITGAKIRQTLVYCNEQLEKQPCSILPLQASIASALQARAEPALGASAIQSNKAVHDFTLVRAHQTNTDNLAIEHSKALHDLKVMYMFHYIKLYGGFLESSLNHRIAQFEHAHKAYRHAMRTSCSSTIAAREPRYNYIKSAEQAVYCLALEPDAFLRQGEEFWWRVLEGIDWDVGRIKFWEREGHGKSRAPPTPWLAKLIVWAEMLMEEDLGLLKHIIREFVNRLKKFDFKQECTVFREMGAEALATMMRDDAKHFDNRVPVAYDALLIGDAVYAARNIFSYGGIDEKTGEAWCMPSAALLALKSKTREPTTTEGMNRDAE